jgi:ComF family protein
MDCKGRYPDLEGIMIAFNYSHLIKKLILSLKYYHIYSIADFFAQKIALLCSCNYLLNQDRENNQTLITSVPSHRYRRLFIKGYNQSQLLAQACAQHLGIPYQSIVKKRKKTHSQASLDRKKRLTNLHWSFQLASPLTNSIKTIIIVDDITTTGSTLQEIAHCIKQSYPHVRIRGAVVARSNK